MIEVKVFKNILDQNLTFFSLKEQYIPHNQKWIYYAPNNNDFLKYWQFRKYVIAEYYDLTTFTETLYFDSLPDTNIERYHTSWFISTDYIIFHFLDNYPEEEIFYFKLKYGGC